MIPVEVTRTPWHFTTWPDALDHWQTLIAGLLALFAAIITVRVTLRVERGKADRGVDALRKSLAVELRQQIPRALAVYISLLQRAITSDAPITARIVESLSRAPAPIIYSANAGKIGLLEGDAMNVAIVYTLLESARDAVTRLMTSYRTPDNIDRAVVLKTAEAFLEGFAVLDPHAAGGDDDIGGGHRGHGARRAHEVLFAEAIDRLVDRRAMADEFANHILLADAGPFVARG